MAALFFLVVLFLFLTGCGSVIKIPKPPSDLIKEYKSTIVTPGGAGMFNSGVQVNKGDYISILAEGTINYWAGNPGNTFGPEGRLLIRVGKKGFVKRYYPPQASFVAAEPGNIYLGYAGGPIDSFGESSTPGYYRDDVVHYAVDIIVWQKNDPVRIADFLAEASRSDPKNKVLKDLAEGFQKRKEMVLAEQKAKKEIEDAKKAIVALQGKEVTGPKKMPERIGGAKPIKGKPPEEAKPATPSAKEEEASGVKDAQKERQIAELNEKLPKASQALKEARGGRGKVNLLEKGRRGDKTAANLRRLGFAAICCNKA